MGYRSKVIFGVKETHKDKFNKLIEEVDKIGGNGYHKEHVKIVKPIYETDNWIVFEDDYLKWYDDFDEVQLINDTIQEWYDGDEDMGAFRICLGEDGYKDECGEWYSVVAETHDINIIEKTE
tara:strand:- start:27 stop:392 length:366 start_codon:yes stop_codon:yes gene_type:complete